MTTATLTLTIKYDTTKLGDDKALLLETHLKDLAVYLLAVSSSEDTLAGYRDMTVLDYDYNVSVDE
jgi:hypothetical protein